MTVLALPAPTSPTLPRENYRPDLVEHPRPRRGPSSPGWATIITRIISPGPGQSAGRRTAIGRLETGLKTGKGKGTRTRAAIGGMTGLVMIETETPGLTTIREEGLQEGGRAVTIGERVGSRSQVVARGRARSLGLVIKEGIVVDCA